ncbi:MAG TPA: ATP-binding protein [Candidatus Nanoarchaeia archaeon]|nr:ATP-binding protein [Candidatus Nanoarchaeia archaeon]
MPLNFKTTADIKIAKNLPDQVIGQEEAMEIVRKAAQQRRHVLLIGEPGVGKSLTGQALAELLPKENLTDIAVFSNAADENVPLVREFPRGKGRLLVNKSRLQHASAFKYQNLIFYVLIILAIISPWYVRKEYGDILAAATLISSMIMIAIFVVFMNLSRKMKNNVSGLPKLLVDSSGKEKAPFLDATGAHAGALLGDVLHDPLQSFVTGQELQIISNTGKNQQLIQQGKIELIDQLLEKHQKEIIRKGNYHATFLGKNELVVLGEKENKVQSVDVLSVNRYEKEGDIIKITTGSGKEIVVTPEHKVAIKWFNKIKYLEASKLKPWHRILALDGE